MPVPPHVLDEIRASIDLLDLVGRVVNLRKAGANWKGLCPFHAEKTPSFMVNPKKGIFHCFGCGVGGDVAAIFSDELGQREIGVAVLFAAALLGGAVQSALGEPLRVEIDLPEINAEEVSSLRAVVASPAAYRAAGLELNPALANAEIVLQKRPDGRYFLRITSDRRINEPFVDLILEANWSSGRIVRDYTMLFDPPTLRQPSAQLAPQVTPVPDRAPAQTAPTPPRRSRRSPIWSRCRRAGRSAKSWHPERSC